MVGTSTIVMSMMIGVVLFTADLHAQDENDDLREKYNQLQQQMETLTQEMEKLRGLLEKRAPTQPGEIRACVAITFVPRGNFETISGGP